MPEAPGLIVDATMHDRGRPVGRDEDAQKYFSGKHHIYWPVTHGSDMGLRVCADRSQWGWAGGWGGRAWNVHGGSIAAV
jgi:hypothetical protein